LKINHTSLDLPLCKPCPETLFKQVAGRRKAFVLPEYNLVGDTKNMICLDFEEKFAGEGFIGIRKP